MYIADSPPNPVALSLHLLSYPEFSDTLFCTSLLWIQKVYVKQFVILHYIAIRYIMPHEVMIMPDYKKMYLHLFNHVSDALEALEQQNFGQAKEILVAAQQQAEDEYVESE